MHEYGGERVIRSLCSYSCNLSMSSLLISLPIKIEDDIKKELWREYIAVGVRMLTANTAGAETTTFLTADFTEIITKTETADENADEIINKIVNGVNGGA